MSPTAEEWLAIVRAVAASLYADGGLLQLLAVPFTFVVGLAASGQLRQGALYGVLGGLFLLLTWFYAANLLLLLGFVVDAVFSRRAVIRSAGGSE